MAKGRILVVEDDFDISNMLRIYFSGQGYDVQVAPRGGDALTLTRKQLPQLIVLDIMLPDMDGYAVCRELRQTTRTSHIPIIFLTQKDERSDKIAGLELGADDYITKPFDIEELKLRVKNAIDRVDREKSMDPRSNLPSSKLIEEQLRELMRTTDIFLAFPRLILALAFVAALGPGIENAIIAIAITSWPPYARLARAETLTIRDSDFINAARLQGASAVRILWGHVAPLCLSSIIIRVTLDMAGIILTAAGLGFLGLGAQPPQPEWGAMIASGRRFLIDQWWVATMPGIAIFVVSLGFNLLGDGLRDVLDPKARK